MSWLHSLKLLHAQLDILLELNGLWIYLENPSHNNTALGLHWMEPNQSTKHRYIKSAQRMFNSLKKYQASYVNLRCTHPIQNWSPALHSYTLKNCQHGKDNVIKRCNSIIWTFPLLQADTLISSNWIKQLENELKIFNAVGF